MKKLTTLCWAMSAATFSQAATMYVLPSDTMLSGNASWVTFDAAYADYIFTPIHSVAPDTLSATSPSGKKMAIQHASEGKLRTAFELELQEKGTYAVSSLRKFYYVKYKKAGEEKLQKWKGSAAEFTEKIKDKQFADSVDQVRDYTLRADTFVSLGEPTENGLKADDSGYDFDFITHPNDYNVGEKAVFVLKKNGQPVADTKVKVERASARFLFPREVQQLKTDSEGRFSIVWEKPGQYALSIRSKGKKPEDKLQPQERTRYYATVEVFGE